MNVELMSVLAAVAAVGIGLSGLTLASGRGLRNEMRDMRRETREEIQELRQEMRQEVHDMRGQLERVDSHIGELRERIAGLEGLLTGLREAIVRRAVAG